MTSQYLPLTEYSSKYKVSISTLRRRIKADEIKYVFEDGKYLILDNGVTTQGDPALDHGNRNVHRPSQKSEKTETTIAKSRRTSPAPSAKPAATWQPKLQTVAAPQTKEPSADSAFSFAKEAAAFADATVWNEEFRQFDARDRQEPILTAANRLLTELKKAYAQVLQEKEETILLLKEECSDLKTLVRALESEHAKNKNRSR